MQKYKECYQKKPLKCFTTNTTNIFVKEEYYKKLLIKEKFFDEVIDYASGKKTTLTMRNIGKRYGFGHIEF